MKQIDYLRLVATSRNSIYYERPSDADEALTGLVGICFILSLVLVLVAAVVAALLGAPMDGDYIGGPILATVLPGIAFFVCGLFIGGAHMVSRWAMIAIGVAAAALIVYLVLTVEIPAPYLYAAPVLYCLTISFGAARQLQMRL